MERFSLVAGLAMAVLVILGAAGAQAQDSAAATTTDGLWLGFDFDGTLEPTAGSAKDLVKVKFERESAGVGPAGVEVALNAPRFTKGLQGKGIYLGGTSSNLLKPELADIEFKDAKIEGVNAIESATLEQVKSDDAWFGESSLKVTTSKRLGSGLSIPFTVSGGGHYVFSLFVRGEGQLAMKINAPEGTAWHVGPERSVVCTREWTRYAVWVYATDPVQASVSLASVAGERGEFFIDALQLEKRERIMAGPDKKQYPYGDGLAPGPWTRGRTKAAIDKFTVNWDQGVPFPIAEGTYTLWIKTDWGKGDCESHGLVNRYYQWSELLFQGYDQYSFWRGKNTAENNEKITMGEIRVARPSGLKAGKWHHCAVTWSNKGRKSVLYFDGQPVGDVLTVSDSTYANGSLIIGSDLAFLSALNGVMDNLRVYSRALSADEVKSEHQAGAALLGQGK